MNLNFVMNFDEFMVFTKGGRLSSRIKIVLKNKEVQIVNESNYLGVIFTNEKFCIYFTKLSNKLLDVLS